MIASLLLAISTVFIPYPSQSIAPVNTAILGAGLCNDVDVTTPGIAGAFWNTYLTLSRFPCGADADVYDWQTGADLPVSCQHPAANPNSTWANYVADVAVPAQLTTDVVVNYGSGTPALAGAWVAKATAPGSYIVSTWTVGNETYASGSCDEHPNAHTWQSYVTYEPAFNDAMQSATFVPIEVCIPITPSQRAWDAGVMAGAKYQCGDLHYYAQQSGSENDADLVGKGPAAFTAAVTTEQARFAAAGHPNTPIVVGELGCVVGTPGKQSQSPACALFLAQAIGEAELDKVQRLTVHTAIGQCYPPSAGGNFSSKLYGSQQYGSSGIFSNPNPTRCPGNAAPFAAQLATAYALQVTSSLICLGGNMIAVSVTGADLKAYAASCPDGSTRVMLVNTNETQSKTITVGIAGKTSGSGGTLTTYGKTQYAASTSTQWVGPTLTSLPAWSGSIPLRLAPWSVSVAEMGTSMMFCSVCGGRKK